MREGFSEEFLRACYMASTSKILTLLLRIEHPDLVTPLRYNNKIGDLTSNGDVYESRMFTMSLPNEITDSLPQVPVTIDNADNVISYACFGLDTAEKYDVYLSICLKDTPNVIEYESHFIAAELAVDDVTAVFNCTLEQGLESTWPKDAMTPYSHPHLFGSTS